jgi:hypothetical protein
VKLVRCGASGMIGSAVLLTALRDPDVQEIPSGRTPSAAAAALSSMASAGLDLAQAMWRAIRDGEPSAVKESRDINALAGHMNVP